MAAASPVVVDTDVISFLFKDHPVASAYRSILAGRSLAVSLISIAEIEYGMESKSWGARRRELMGRFLSRFTILYPGDETARIWALIKHEGDKKGRPITFADAWIAAEALRLNIPLVTHNSRDFESVGDLRLLTARNPV